MPSCLEDQLTFVFDLYFWHETKRPSLIYYSWEVQHLRDPFAGGEMGRISHIFFPGRNKYVFWMNSEYMVLRLILNIPETPSSPFMWGVCVCVWGRETANKTKWIIKTGWGAPKWNRLDRCLSALWEEANAAVHFTARGLPGRAVSSMVGCEPTCRIRDLSSQSWLSEFRRIACVFQWLSGL